MDVLYYLERKEKYNKPSIYLAGPTSETSLHTEWRLNALSLLRNYFDFDGYVFIPEFRHDLCDKDYSKIIDWELEMMERAAVILFWIPRDVNHLPGFTTNIEFGEYLKSGKIVIGSPDNACKMDYLKERCCRLNIIWFGDLEKCIEKSINKVENNTKIFFTADTHFGHERTRILSKRPFEDVLKMDLELVNNWNGVITNNDIVYFLGDFGNVNYLKHLNFKKMMFLPGNYDNTKFLNVLFRNDRIEMIGENTCYEYNNIEFRLVHEPKNAIVVDKFYLFGHVHKLSMIKKNGLNVGMDCHCFCPIDIETILFYYNAIKNHYDENVFIDILGELDK